MASTYWGPCLGTDWALWWVWILKFAWWVCLLNSSPLRTVCSFPALQQVALLEAIRTLLSLAGFLVFESWLFTFGWFPNFFVFMQRFIFSFFPLHAFWPSWAHPWPFSIRRFRSIFQALTTVFSHHLRHILWVFFLLWLFFNFYFTLEYSWFTILC